LEVPFIGDKALAGLQYLEKVGTKRTGIGEATAALDETAIDPQTATAEQIQHDANYARTELMVRTMAKVGLKELFASLLRLTVRHQDRPRTDPAQRRVEKLRSAPLECPDGRQG
jgi:hypothetical protein